MRRIHMLCVQGNSVMNSISYQETAANFVVQAIIVFFAILSSVNIIYSFLLAAFSMSGFEATHGVISDFELPLIILVIVFWAITQLRMLTLVYKAGGRLTTNSENYSSKWLGVIWPAIFLFWFSIIFMVALIPALIVGAILNIYINEFQALMVVIFATSGALYWFFTSERMKFDPTRKNIAKDA